MQQHVEKGVMMLETIGGSMRRVIPIVLAHHDKFDGSGYHPKRGEEIPLEARIISVADVWDSLTSDRPYRKAMSPFDAKDILMKGSGTDFDPQVIGGVPERVSVRRDGRHVRRRVAFAAHYFGRDETNDASSCAG